MEYIKAAFQFVFLFISNIILVLIGLFVVAIALPFRVDGVSGSDGRRISNLPRCVWIFGNDYDGVLGDKRGWWAANTPFKLPVDHFISMYTWAALRNPVNNKRFTSMFSATVAGSIISYKGNFKVKDKAGQEGWQFVTTENKGKKWYGFYLVKLWSLERAFVIRLGYKVEPSHIGTTEPKGMTTKINLYKAI